MASIWKRRQRHIVLGRSKIHGFGVFATKNFRKGEVVEVCPVMSVTDKTKAILLANSPKAVSDFGNFMFETEDGSALAFGYGSFYNHSVEPNADYSMIECFGRSCLEIVAWRRIEEGDEILLNYNGDPDDQADVFGENGWWDST